MTTVRNFEPDSIWSIDGKLTERAIGFLRSIIDAIGGNSAGRGLIGALGADGISTTTFLREDGVFDIPDYPIGATPTGSVGTATIPGTAVTFLRSDAAPPLSLSITPTWTGAHIFNAGVTTSTLVSTSSATIGTGFGCNGKAAQTSAAANAAISATAGAAYTATEQGMLNDLKALVNQIRAALVADGVMV